MAAKDEAIATIEPAYLANFTEDTIRELIESNLDENVNVSNFPRVSVPAGGGSHFLVPTLDEPDGEAEKMLNGVMVHTHMSRVYFSKPYGEGDDEPDCSSEKADFGTPRHEDVGDEYGGECTECPKSAFGSAINGRGQACTQQRIVYLLLAGDNLPVVVIVPPTSLGVFTSFSMGLTRKGLFAWQVEMSLSLESVQNKDGVQYSRIKLRKSRDLTEEEQQKAYAYKQGIVPFL